MRTITRIDYLTSATRHKLADAVNKRLQEGWQPYGPVVSGLEHTQAIVQYAPLSHQFLVPARPASKPREAYTVPGTHHPAPKVAKRKIKGKWTAGKQKLTAVHDIKLSPAARKLVQQGVPTDPKDFRRLKRTEITRAGDRVLYVGGSISGGKLPSDSIGVRVADTGYHGIVRPKRKDRK